MVDSQETKGSNAHFAQQVAIPAPMARYRFDAFMLDVECARLVGPEGDIRLRAKAFRVLAELLESAPQIVSTERLLDRIWGTRHLTRNAVAQTIQEVRQALKGGSTELIENVPKLGYRVVVPVERIRAPAAEPVAPVAVEQIPVVDDDPAARSVEESSSSPLPRAPERPLERPRRGFAPPVMAVLVITVLALLGWLTWSLYRPEAGFTSAADVGIHIEGRGAAPIEAALRQRIGQSIERQWKIRPVDLSAAVAAGSATSVGAEVARRFQVDTWYGGHLVLGTESGQSVVDGELVVGSTRGSTTLAVPITAMPLAELPELAARIAKLLGEVAAWNPHHDEHRSPPLPDVDAARITEADVAIAQGHPDTAQVLLDGVSAPARKHPDYLESRARALLLQGRHQSVLKLFPQEPEDDDLRLLWARAKGDRARAVQIAQRRFEANPASAQHGLEYIEAILNARDHRRALAELDRIEQRPMSQFDRDEFTLLRAMVLNAQGASEQGERLLAGLVQSLQELGTSELQLRARHEQGLAISFIGRWDEALEIYSEVAAKASALGLARLEARATFNIADIRKAQGDTEGAATLLRGAIRRFSEPDFVDLLPDLQLGLAYIAMDNGDISEADKMAEATARLISRLESTTLPASVSALRAEIALVRLDMQSSITLMEQAVTETCGNGEYGDASRQLLRLSGRYLLADAVPAAQEAVRVARAACRAVGDPEHCRTYAHTLNAIVNEGAREPALMVAMSSQKRPLRDYYAATLALLRAPANDQAKAAIPLGNQLAADAPAHFRAMWVVVTHLVALEAGSDAEPMPSELARRFPELASATTVIAALATERTGRGNLPLAPICAATPHPALCDWATRSAQQPQGQRMSSPWTLNREPRIQCEIPAHVPPAQPGVLIRSGDQQAATNR